MRAKVLPPFLDTYKTSHLPFHFVVSDMNRPIFYVLSLFLHGCFWLVLLLSNYADYTSSAPEVLGKDYAELFEANRMMLVLAELFFPFLMLAASVVLLIVKFRPRPVRLPYLLMLFMGLEFWVWRTFFFPDRMGSYYAMSELQMKPDAMQESHFFNLAIYLLLGLVVIGIKEYSQPENPLSGTILEALEKKQRKPAPWESQDNGPGTPQRDIPWERNNPS